ncbi:hypothetical protein ABFX02_12G008600 [Erythranthe guttata]
MTSMAKTQLKKRKLVKKFAADPVSPPKVEKKIAKKLAATEPISPPKIEKKTVKKLAATTDPVPPPKIEKKVVKKSAAAADPVPPPPEKKLKKKKKKAKLPESGSNDSDSESDPQTQIQTLLEPFSKDQLVTLVTDLSVSNPSLLSLLESAADQDISHRKIFVHGLGWDVTRLSVEPIFASYGEIEDLNVVSDRVTGKCKGYAFLTFKTRKSAKKLLKNPRLQIRTRLASCQLASEGSVPPSTASTATAAATTPAAGRIVSQQHFSSSDYPDRKIYVRKVPLDASPDRLKALFEQFGEIENGPKGLDPATGRFKGYAIFVYKTIEGAKKALEQPFKYFEGSQLHCQKAIEGKGHVSSGAASITTALQPVQPQMMAAVAAAQQVQNMAMLGQQAALVNPLYANLSALMGSYYGMMGAPVQGLDMGMYGVPDGGAAAAGVGGGIGGLGSEAMYQGLQYTYPNMQSVKASPALAKGSGTSGSGYSPSL